MREIDGLKHNLRVETEARDHYHAEIIQKDIVIENDNRALVSYYDNRDKLEAVIIRYTTALEKIQHWPMNRDAVKALGLCQHEAKKALENVA